MKVVAIIPARGGSKGIPRKNIRPLHGIPLIAYSIAAARSTKCIDRVFVSTDDPEIAAVACSWGAEVPFLRPRELSGDLVTDLPVMVHAVNWLERKEGYRPDLVVQVRPTSPFRPSWLLDKAVGLLASIPAADSVRSVTPAGENPYKMWRIENEVLVPLLTTGFKEPYNMPRQQLPETFWQTGHVDVFRFRTLAEKGSLTGEVILPCIVPHQYAVDLDNMQQWALAEFLMREACLDIIRPDGGAPPA